MISAMVQAVMVFYGLAVALIAVNVWQTHSDVAKIVTQQAAAVAALHRDVGAYPEPIRSQLQDQLEGYVNYIIHEAWPLQRQGQVPSGGVELVSGFQAVLTGTFVTVALDRPSCGDLGLGPEPDQLVYEHLMKR